MTMCPSKENRIRAIMKGTIGMMYGTRIIYSKNFKGVIMLYEVAIIICDPNGKAFKYEIAHILAKDVDEAKMKVAAASSLIKDLDPINSVVVKVRGF